VNITHITKRRVASALGATVAAAAVPALLFVAEGAAQAAPPAPIAIHSLPEAGPGDVPLAPGDADCTAAQTAMTNASNEYGAAVKEQGAAQERYDFDKKGPFWNSIRSNPNDPFGENIAEGTSTIGQYDTQRLNAANQRVADLQPTVRDTWNRRNAICSVPVNGGTFGG
jgi:hypothetical protein